MIFVCIVWQYYRLYSVAILFDTAINIVSDILKYRVRLIMCSVETGKLYLLPC